MSDVRPVWLTRADRDMIEDFLGHAGHLVQAWDAAPADSAEALLAIVGRAPIEQMLIDDLLHALGMPK